MEFHLIYAGDLLKAAGRASTRAWEKHSIRRYLHDQIKRLWETHPALRFYGSKTVEQPGLQPQKFLDALAQTCQQSGIGFIPLVTAPNGLVCSLDVLFLRPDQPGNILNSAGDIDNRIKVLIDALRIPREAEMRKKEGDEPDPNPMYRLLQDDKLITALKVKTDRLLFPTSSDPNEVCLVIRVETANVDPFGSPWELHL